MSSNPKSLIEKLKAAGKEIKKASLKAAHRKTSSPNEPLLAEKKEKTVPLKSILEEIDLIKKSDQAQGLLDQEKFVLEGTHQQIKGIKEKLKGRIELLKRLQKRGMEIDKTLEEFQEELSLAIKENIDLKERINLLGWIKNKLKRFEKEDE